ncbi:ribokinase [Luteibacter rhizovicinus]|uniref:Ribokinase n=1 Tax=Luteibacter rhizovicinus TaxID=242606 RepID=A0A4R3YKD5_9GAMM|nr:ribokinase [Luteibacter rhizovicinus]TCV92726.1 ribokinase [Luteibacter rhizovicinus]
MTTPRTGTVLVAGSANLDFVVRASHVPAPGETVLGHAFETMPGGKGANQAVASARAGGAVTRMLLALGDDTFAVPIEASLRDAGVELDIMRAHGQPTGVAFVCLSDTAENAITVAPGANSLLEPGHLPPLAGVTHVLLQLETPLASVEAWARAARAAGVAVVLNAAPARTLPASLLADVDILIVNENELATLTGVEDIATGMDRLDVACLVVTLGARGCCARMGKQRFLQAAFAVQPVDTTGAGDTFCGTLVAALSRGLAFGQALRRAGAASALACTRLGAQAGVPAHDEVERLLAADSPDATTEDLAIYCSFA